MYPGAQLSQHITIHDVTSAHARNEHIHVQVCENRTHDPTLLGGYVQYCTTPWPTDSHSVTTINLYWSIVSYRVKRRIKNTDEVPSRLSSPKTINKTGGGGAYKRKWWLSESSRSISIDTSLGVSALCTLSPRSLPRKFTWTSPRACFLFLRVLG